MEKIAGQQEKRVVYKKSGSSKCDSDMSTSVAALWTSTLGEKNMEVAVIVKEYLVARANSNETVNHVVPTLACRAESYGERA